jgi:hypothetical protein
MLGRRVRQVNRPVLRNWGSFAAVPKSGESGTNDSALVATNDRSLSELPRDAEVASGCRGRGSSDRVV